MTRKLSLPVFIVLILLIFVPAALAITFGEPDGDGHPNVGAMIVQPPDGEKFLLCSGTLIAPQVFLTAAHCAVVAADFFGVDPHDTYVTFDPIWDENATLYRGTYDLNPSYGHDSYDANDIAVVILDEPITDPIIEPAALPPAGLLDDMKSNQTLIGKLFITVGYGQLRDEKTQGPHARGSTGERYVTEGTFQALKPYWLQISMNPSTGDGGTCLGDSGGPHFLGDSNVIASLTVTGDTNCRATDVTYRLDTDSARTYLSQFVSLP